MVEAWRQVRGGDVGWGPAVEPHGHLPFSFSSFSPARLRRAVAYKHTHTKTVRLSEFISSIIDFFFIIHTLKVNYLPIKCNSTHLKNKTKQNKKKKTSKILHLTAGLHVWLGSKALPPLRFWLCWPLKGWELRAKLVLPLLFGPLLFVLLLLFPPSFPCLLPLRTCWPPAAQTNRQTSHP